MRMRPPPPTAATMRARRMINAMTGTEPPTAAPGQPVRTYYEARRRSLRPMRQEQYCLANAIEDSQTVTVKPNISFNAEQKSSPMDIAIKTKPKGTKVGGISVKRLVVLWVQS